MEFARLSVMERVVGSSVDLEQVSSAVEATERLVGSLVFKTSGGTRVPRRVRFPSASATPPGDSGAEPGSVSATHKPKHAF